MPLIASVLSDEIRKISDIDFDGFEGFPTTPEETAARWANALDVYASGVVPSSISTAAAKSAAESVFLGLGTPAAAVAFPAGFAAYAASLATGMAPAFIGVPPPAPLILIPVFAAGFAGASAETCATLFSTTVDLWFKTGTATLPPPAPPAPFPWS